VPANAKYRDCSAEFCVAADTNATTSICHNDRLAAAAAANRRRFQLRQRRSSPPLVLYDTE